MIRAKAKKVSRTAIDRALRGVAELWRPPDPAKEKAALGLAPEAALKTTNKRGDCNTGKVAK